MVGSGADIRVYESRRGVAWAWAAASVVFGLFLFFSHSNHGADDFFGDLLGLIVAVYGGFYFVTQARHPPRIRVQKEALVIERHGKAPVVLPWNHIDSFVIVRRRGLELLGYRLRKGVGKSPMASLSRMFEGADVVIYGFWPEKAKVMVDALTMDLSRLRDLSAPLDLNVAIVSAPTSQPPPAPVYTPPPQQPFAAKAPQAVSEPRRWFGGKAKTDENGNRPIVW